MQILDLSNPTVFTNALQALQELAQANNTAAIAKAKAEELVAKALAPKPRFISDQNLTDAVLACVVRGVQIEHVNALIDKVSDTIYVEHVPQAKRRAFLDSLSKLEAPAPKPIKVEALRGVNLPPIEPIKPRFISDQEVTNVVNAALDRGADYKAIWEWRDTFGVKHTRDLTQDQRRGFLAGLPKPAIKVEAPNWPHILSNIKGHTLKVPDGGYGIRTPNEPFWVKAYAIHSREVAGLLGIPDLKTGAIEWSKIMRHMLALGWKHLGSVVINRTHAAGYIRLATDDLTWDWDNI